MRVSRVIWREWLRVGVRAEPGVAIGRASVTRKAVPRRVATRLAAVALATLGLGGCGGPDNLIATGAALGAGIVSVATIGRSPVDAVYSLVTGRDCSIVRLDEGKSYCRPVDPPPESQPFCTRTLGAVNCWADPANLPGHPVQVGEAPPMTAEQEAYRVRKWPWW